MYVSVRALGKSDHEWVKQVFLQYWGADFVVTRGRCVTSSQVDGFYAVDRHEDRLGLVTFQIIGDQCEIVSLDAFVQFAGIGTALVTAVKKAASAAACRRVWLITTNDNLDAIRFYQRRDFQLAQVHRHAIELSRKLKPSIPLLGNFGIPIRDELEFEMLL